MALNLYPNSSKQNYKELNKQGFTVFANGERLETPVNVNTTGSNFWRHFLNPVYRIPAMVICDSGRIIVGADYRSQASDQVAILPAIAYSDDNGLTWKKKLIDTEVAQQNAYYRVMDQTMFRFQGKIHIICGAWNGTGNNVNWTQTRNDVTWQVIRYWSDDDGETWHRQLHFENSLSNRITDGSSWLGGVGHCVVTRHGTCVVPIQISRARGQVSVSFIHSRDGETWTKANAERERVSETSIGLWYNASNTPELAFISRKDPNHINKKAVYYVTESSAGNFSNSFSDYGIYNDKIPALGGAGCNGGALMLADETGNKADYQNLIYTYAGNYYNGISAYMRDHIILGSFPYTNRHDTGTRKQTDIEVINPNAGAFSNNGTPFGGYSCLAFNSKCNKLFVAYEDMLGIKVKNLTHLLPQLKYHTNR